MFFSLHVSSARHAIEWAGGKGGLFSYQLHTNICPFVLILTAFPWLMAELVSGFLCSFSPDALTLSFTFISATWWCYLPPSEFLFIAMQARVPVPLTLQLLRDWHYPTDTENGLWSFPFAFKNENDHQSNKSSGSHEDTHVYYGNCLSFESIYTFMKLNLSAQSHLEPLPNTALPSVLIWNLMYN